jgi:hypothetical protein
LASKLHRLSSQPLTFRQVAPECVYGSRKRRRFLSAGRARHAAMVQLASQTER